MNNITRPRIRLLTRSTNGSSLPKQLVHSNGSSRHYSSAATLPNEQDPEDNEVNADVTNNGSPSSTPIIPIPRPIWRLKPSSRLRRRFLKYQHLIEPNSNFDLFHDANNHFQMKSEPFTFFSPKEVDPLSGKSVPNAVESLFDPYLYQPSLITPATTSLPPFTALPAYLDPYARKTIFNLTNFYLSQRKPHQKHVLLTCPHPGAVPFLNNVVNSLALETNAIVLRLEFFHLAHVLYRIASEPDFMKTLSENTIVDPSTPRNTDSFSLSTPFNPNNYRVFNNHSNDDLTDIDQLGEEEDDIERAVSSSSAVVAEEEDGFWSEEEDDFPSGFPNKGFRFGAPGGVSGAALAIPFPAPSITLNIHLPEKSTTTSGPNKDKVVHQIQFSPSSIRAGNDNDASTNDNAPFHYYGRKIISENDIKTLSTAFATYLDNLIRTHSRRNIIIHFPDMTEAIISNPSAHSKLFKSLAQAVETVQQRHISQGHQQGMLIMNNATPSLLNEDNRKNIVFWNEFLADGMVFDKRSGEKLGAIEESTLFATVYDNLLKPGSSSQNGIQFSKLLVPPPKYNKDAHSIGLINQWVQVMHEGYVQRVWEINRNGFMQVCSDMEIALFDPIVLKDSLTKITSKLDKCEPLKELFSHDIWGMEKMERFVEMALGIGLRGAESGLTSRFALTTPVLIKAVEMMKKSTYKSYKHVEFSDYEEKGAEALDVEPSASSSVRVSESSSTTTESAPIANMNTTTTTTSASTTTAIPSTTPLQPPTNNPINISQKFKHSKLSAYEKKIMGCVVDPAKIQLGFNDLVLPPSVKHTLQTLVSLPLLRHDLFDGILSKHFITGVLLFGPPGTGKTALAKAVAKNCGANFLSISLADIFDKYVGEGEKNVKAIFSMARKLSPCVVFLDEVDALFGRRDGFREGRREVLNEFMMEWDGLLSNASTTTTTTNADSSSTTTTPAPPPRVLVISATNRPFDLDDAILRRLPRRILIDLPDKAAREQILRVHLKEESLHADMDVSKIAERTEGWSGSDLKNLCVSAAVWSVKEVIWKEVKGVGWDEGMIESESGTGTATESKDNSSPKVPDWESWGSVFASLQQHHQNNTGPANTPSSTTTPKRILTHYHFELAFKEISPSLSDEMQTLSELRKWNELFGEASDVAKRKRRLRMLGFGEAIGSMNGIKIDK